MSVSDLEILQILGNTQALLSNMIFKYIFLICHIEMFMFEKTMTVQPSRVWPLGLLLCSVELIKMHY